MFAARLQAYLPGGAAQGELPRPISWEASVVHNDVGALTIDYSTLMAGGDLIARPLKDGLEVAVEIWNGLGNWVEARGCRFIRLDQDQADQADGAKVYRVIFVSFGWLLKKATLLGGTFTNGQRTFVAPKAGELLSTILAENAARSGIPMTIIGGGANDAGGDPWPALEDQKFKYGQDYQGIVRGLQEAGAMDWATQARGLYAFLPDSPDLSPDLSASIFLKLGVDITEAPAKETLADLLGRLGVSADAGGTTVVTEPTAPSPHGVWEGHLGVGQVTDETAAQAMGQYELEKSGKARQQFTHGLLMREGSPVPLLDYWPGCWITAPTNLPLEKVRVQQITITFGKDGYGANVVLNDRLTEIDIRRARTLGSLSGGQVGSTGGPAPIAVDPEASRVPSVPGSFDITAALTFIGPTPRGQVTGVWNAVTTATDSGPITISGYEFQWRIGAGAWQTRFTPEITARVENQTPGDSIEARVRAVAPRSEFPSAWSAVDTVVVPGDVTPPGVPSLPVVTSRLGTITVAWDGLDNAAQPMAADLDRVQIAVGPTSTPTTVVSSLKTAGAEVITGQTYGSVRYVRMRSVDTTGNTSAWSVAAEITVNAVQGPDLEANSVTTNALAAGSVTSEALAATIAVLGSIRSGDTGQRYELDPFGIRLYNSSDEIWVNFPTTAGEKATVRGVIEADGLTVREGASFYSPLNEFAPDSVIALSEQVAAPLAAPNVSNFWSSNQIAKPSVNDTLGNFALDMSLVQSVTWNPSINALHLVQKAPGTTGTRIWYYTLGGSLGVSGINNWDIHDWDVTSIGVGTDGLFRVMFKYGSKWWISDYSRAPGAQIVEYIPNNSARRPLLTMDGNDVWVTETNASGTLIFRRMNTAVSPATVFSGITTSGIPDQSLNPVFLYRGSADFGSAKFVAGYANSFIYRVFDTAGAYDATRGFYPPVTRVGAFWNNTTSRFYTVGQDGRIYTHTNMHWTDPLLDTWNLAQTFRDSAGTTHETVIGAIKTFNPYKRSYVRVGLAQVPYAGGADDPNGWRLYGKTGTVPPAIGTGMFLQVSGSYTVLQTDIGTLLSTVSSAPPTTSNFPNENPAILRSARTMPSDATKSIIEMRGDGAGRFGILEVSNTGVLSRAGLADIEWTAITPAGGWTGAIEGRRRNGDITIRAMLTPGAVWTLGSSKTLVSALPANFQPPAAWPFFGAQVSSAAAGDLYFQLDIQGAVIVARSSRTTSGASQIAFVVTYPAV